MKKQAAILLAAVIFTGFFSGCISEGGNTASSGESSVTSIENGVDSTMQTSQTTDSMEHATYKPVPMKKYLLIEEGELRQFSSLLSFVAILQEANIPILEIKGASRASVTDSGDVVIDETPLKKQWDHIFSQQMDSLYDTNLLTELVERQAIEAIFVKTPYEIYTFRQSLGHPGKIALITEFHSSTMRTRNPNFVTEKGIKIDDTFTMAVSAYGLTEDDIIKISDNEWWLSAWGDCIRFYGTKDIITSMDLGVRPYRDE